MDRGSLEQELEKLKQKLQQQEQTLKEAEKQQVRITRNIETLYSLLWSVNNAKWGFSPVSSEGRTDEGEE